MRADIASLVVTGPEAGSAVSNLGMIEKKRLHGAKLSEAVVTIHLKAGGKDELVADCHGVFTLVASYNPEECIVGFPVTGQSSHSVHVDAFSVTVDGTAPASILRRPIRFPSIQDRVVDAELFPAYDAIAAGTWTPNTFFDGNTYPEAFYWRQTFKPNAQSIVDVTYKVTLHAQPLRYSRRFSRHSSVDVVPFDLMVAGTDEQKAYFFDYILRSGATWNGAIGHEIVTLTAAPELGIEFDDPAVVPVADRKVATYWDDGFSDAAGLLHAMIDPPHLRRERDKLVWEISNEKPNRDILVELPAMALHHGKGP